MLHTPTDPRFVVLFALCAMIFTSFALSWGRDEAKGLHTGFDHAMSAFYHFFDPLLTWLGKGEGICPDGLLIPGPSTTRGAGILVTLLLFYCFMGVAIGSEVFMAAIEEITSKEYIQLVNVAGGVRRFTMTFWNPTVANLTLMALGSSAPEILLSVIEVGGNRFYSGELGPSTIVGSAAFNMLVISAVCVMGIAPGEVRSAPRGTRAIALRCSSPRRIH